MNINRFPLRAPMYGMQSNCARSLAVESREPNRAGLCGYQKNLECRNSLLIRSDSNGSPGQLSSSTI